MNFSNSPDEVKILLNPSFCGLCLYHFTKTYTEESQKSVSLSLIYIVLPLVLHLELRESLPTSKSTSLAIWVNQNPELIPIIGQKSLALKQFTGLSLLLLLKNGLLEINNGAIHPTNKSLPRVPKKLFSDSEEVTEIMKKSELVGRWLGRSGSESIIYSMLGMKI